jgi:hypothetical protein
MELWKEDSAAHILQENAPETDGAMCLHILN